MKFLKYEDKDNYKIITCQILQHCLLIDFQIIADEIVSSRHCQKLACLRRIAFRFVTFYSLVRDCGIVDISNGANKYGWLYYTMLVAYQLDFSWRLTVFFDDRTTKRANERVSAPWSAPLAALRGVRFQQPHLSLVAYRRDGNSASSAFSYPRKKHRTHNRGPSATVVFLIESDISPLRPRDAIRVIHYAEKPREPKGLSEIT